MQIQPFRPVLPNTALLAAADAFFGVIKEGYLDYRHRGMFIEHPREGLFVYRLHEGPRSYLGLICTMPAEQYDQGLIKKHEGTLAASEQQQLQLLLVREAVVKPVLLTYPAAGNIDSILQRITEQQDPVLHLDDGSVRHELFEVAADHPEGQQLVSAFAKTVPSLYIADGHHRCSTISLYNKQQRALGEPEAPLLAALFSSEQVGVRAFHRVAQLPATLSPLALLARLSNLFILEPLTTPRLPTQRHELTLLVADEAFALTWRPEHLPTEGIALDAGLFNDLVAGPLFGIVDVRTDQRISYVPGKRGLQGVLDKVQRRPDRVGFLLYGLEAADMFSVVDAGLIMPPKSTWFEPRLRNGLVVLEV